MPWWNRPGGDRRGGGDADLAAAAGLAVDRDVAAVAAEAGDVGRGPSGARRRRRGTRRWRSRRSRRRGGRRGGVAEDVEAVVDRDDDDVTSAGDVGAVVEQHRSGAGLEAAAVEPHHHRPLGVVARRRPDVEAEAVLADRRAVALRTAEGEAGERSAARCRRRRSPRRCPSTARPAAVPRNRLAPDGRRAVADALEDADAVVDRCPAPGRARSRPPRMCSSRSVLAAGVVFRGTEHRSRSVLTVARQVSGRPARQSAR